jgi:hypothetical protein
MVKIVWATIGIPQVFHLIGLFITILRMGLLIFQFMAPLNTTRVTVFLNITGTGSDWFDGLISTNTLIEVGECVSFNWSIVRGGIDGVTIGLHSSTDGGNLVNDGEDATIGWESSTALRARADDANFADDTSWRDKSTGKVYNSTICISQGGVYDFFMNSSDSTSPTHTFGSATSWKFGVIPQNGNSETRIYWMGVFNATEGAPTRTPGLVPFISTLGSNSGLITESQSVSQGAILHWDKTNIVASFTIQFTPQINIDGGNVIVVDNVTGTRIANVTVTNDRTVKIGIPQAYQSAGRAFAVFWRSPQGPTFTGVYGGSKFAGTADNGMVLTTYCQDFQDESDYVPQNCYNASTIDNEKGIYQIEWENQTASADTPPVVILINLTSEGGLGQLVNMTDKTCQNPGCTLPSTSDTTPSFSLKTDISAYCRIGVSNLNYTDMGTWRNCTGGGSTFHTCTLGSQDELVYEDSYVYFGCASTNGLENLTSTSGAVKLTITGLEAAGDSAIGAGVQNALLSGYTNYTSQQISARSFTGTQDSGRFDWVTKKGSKVWAFNYVTKGEENVYMFNLTPTLYVLEMRNITSANITKFVETMLNATK